MRRKTIGEEILTKMIEAAAINAGITREEKTEMKEYKCKVELSKEYTITAANPTEARKHAAALFMLEATDDTPHALTPLIQIAEVGTEENDLSWDYEEDEEDASSPYHYRYYEENLGIESDPYEFGFEMVADIVERFRLTAAEKAELERKVALLQFGDSDTLTLPYAEIMVDLLDE